MKEIVFKLDEGKYQLLITMLERVYFEYEQAECVVNIGPERRKELHEMEALMKDLEGQSKPLSFTKNYSW